jgi:CubicO group peptidase (beta-lactamase class C family)
MNKITPLVTAAALSFVLLAQPASAASGCGYPGGAWQSRSPEALDLNAGRLQDALDWANTHTSASVAVYRRGCLAGESRLDAITREQHLDGWSMTKSVTATLVGRAVALRKLRVNQPLRTLYPEADARHGSLKIRHLLTMTAGTHRNWVRDLAPQYDRVRDALSLPFDHVPGTHWEYQQSNVSLLLNAVQRAVGSNDVQQWAQRELFSRIGIARSDWEWDSDRSGNTEGWAHLKMTNAAWARVGQLLLRKGKWNGKQLIAKDYVKALIAPGKVNNAYGYLTWLNGGGTFVLPNVEGEDTGEGQLVTSGPRDMFLFAGSGEQRVFVIPSRELLIVRLGERGSREADTRASVWTGRGGELDNELVRRVLRAVTDVPYDDPGPYQGSDPYLPPPDSGIAGDARDPEGAAAGVGAGPQAPQGCDPTGCN